MIYIRLIRIYRGAMQSYVKAAALVITPVCGILGAIIHEIKIQDLLNLLGYPGLMV